MQNSIKPKLFFLALSLTWHSAYGTPALALSDWEVEREQGIRLEFSKNFSAALPHYKKALAQLSSADANIKLQLQCQIATCYLHLEQRKQALPYLDTILQRAEALRKSRALKADSEMYLVSLIEECENNHAELAKKSINEWFEYIKLAESLCERAVPSQYTPARQASFSRCYIAMGDRQAALKSISAYNDKLSPKDPMYLRMRLKQAALQNSLHQPELLRTLTASLAKTVSVAEAAYLIGEAHIWAAEYAAADKVLCAAYDQLEKQKKLSSFDRIRLLSERFYSSLDAGYWVKAEKLARQCLALDLPENVRTRCLEGLSVSLARQGKTKEAAQVITLKHKNAYNFLEEEERQAAAEAEKRRAGRK